MASPIPPASISGGCSVISNHTLYVYSPAAFQALPLRRGGNWTQLQNGVPATGAVCVKGMVGGNNTDEALWIVGGASNSTKYSGLQRYSFVDGSWETVAPQTKVTQNRQNHAAVFLNTSQSILIYAGSQDDIDVPSSQTFLVSTYPPYSVRSYTAKNFPALSPLLLQWDNNTAITLGGSGTNGEIYHFAKDKGWTELEPSLANDMNSTKVEQGTVIQGSDNSKVLQLFNLGVSPNTITNFVLRKANGSDAASGQTVGGAASRKRKRLTLNDWPTYNATYASTTTRSRYSLAQDPNGMVAFTGGNAQDPVALFNQQDNSWIDTSTFFGLSDSTSTISPTSSATSSPSSTSTSATTTSDGSNHHHTALVLGATLGSILGFIALLIIILLVIRWRRRRRRESRVTEGGDEKQQRLSFADRGAPFMREAGGAGAVNDPLDLNDPFVMGGVGAMTRPSRSLRSESSNAPLVPPDRSNMNANSVELSPIREKAQRDPNRPFVKGERGVPSIILEQDSPRNSAKSIRVNNRGSGWSGYFLGTGDRLTPVGSSKDLRTSGLTPRNSTHLSHDTYLNYDPMRPKSEATNHDCSTHGPTHIPPLKLGQEWDSSRMSQAVTGTSTGAESIPSASTMPARAPSAGTRTISSRTSTDAPSTMGDTVFTHEDNHWTPVTKSDWTKTPTKMPVRDTKSSSYYGDTTHTSTPALPAPKTPSKGTAPSVGGTASGLRKSDGSFWGEPGPQEVVGEDPTTPRTPTRTGKNRAAAGSGEDDADEMQTATPMTLSRPERSVVNSDMSWLKIGN